MACAKGEIGSALSTGVTLSARAVPGERPRHLENAQKAPPNQQTFDSGKKLPAGGEGAWPVGYEGPLVHVEVFPGPGWCQGRRYATFKICKHRSALSCDFSVSCS